MISYNKEQIDCVADDFQYYCLTFNDDKELSWSKNNFLSKKSNVEILFPSIKFEFVIIYAISDIGFLIRYYDGRYFVTCNFIILIIMPLYCIIFIYIMHRC